MARVFFVVALAAVLLIAFGMGLEAILEYWPVAVIILATWLIWRIWQDKHGRYTRKSPEKFRQDYRIVVNKRVKK